MDTKELQIDIKNMKQSIATYEDILVTRRGHLAHAETLLAEAIAAESKKSELVNGDYGKTRTMTGWVYLGEKIYWEDGGVSELYRAISFVDSRKGNIFREMEERQE